MRIWKKKKKKCTSSQKKNTKPKLTGRQAKRPITLVRSHKPWGVGWGGSEVRLSSSVSEKSWNRFRFSPQVPWPRWGLALCNAGLWDPRRLLSFFFSFFFFHSDGMCLFILASVGRRWWHMKYRRWGVWKLTVLRSRHSSNGAAPRDFGHKSKGWGGNKNDLEDFCCHDFKFPLRQQSS